MARPRISVSIAAHFIPHRARFLAQVLRAIAGWQSTDASVIVDTNDLEIQSAPEVRDACQRLKSNGIQIEFALADKIEHPHHLTWVHKQRLRDWSSKTGSESDYFIYLEDDIVLSADNLDYLLQTYPKAAAIGRTPGLIRWEADQDGNRFATDFLEPQIIGVAETLKINEEQYVEPKFPYWAGFIVDRKLAQEYLRSSWAKRDSEEAIDRMGATDCRAQSAFGPTFVAAPRGSGSRIIVPVDNRLRPLPQCLVHHCAQNYVSDSSNDFARIPLEMIFRPSGWAANLDLSFIRLGALFRRVRRKLVRVFS